MNRCRVDTVIVGAGVVGIAVARRLSASGRNVFVLEKHSTFGNETSSRNSEVIHSGIYYPENSLKARLCILGKQMLYDYCQTSGVPYRACGKLIVASEACQEEVIHQLYQKGMVNGVSDLILLGKATLKAQYPRLSACSAIWSPSTGIVDSHQLMIRLKMDAEVKGAQFLFKHEVVKGHFSSGQVELQVIAPDGSRFLIVASEVINCAGLTSLQWLQSSLPTLDLPSPAYAKGSYFSLKGAPPADCLVYPVPEKGGLGVHLTLDMSGAGRFGPDVEWIKQPDYRPSCRSSSYFYREIRKYWPTLPENSLIPGYCGVRPKLVQNGKVLDDFFVQGPEVHGIQGFVNLLGIESPGLTCCLSLGETVNTLLGSE